MASPNNKIQISLMLAVTDTPAAVEWYKKALGANLLWSLGSVAGLELDGSPFFLHESTNKGFNSPMEISTTTTRVELFVDNPEEVITSAVKEGAKGNDVKSYEMPWGVHRQGGFIDPFGHTWSVGDKSPLNRFPV